MEFIDNFETRNNHYTNKIKDSKYIEGNQQILVEEGKKDICEIIIGNHEINYESLEEKEKSMFITNKKLEIASNVILKGNYCKKFSLSLIQNGFQQSNMLSSILYLNDYYNINCIIYNQDTNKYYRTSLKNYEPFFCKFKNSSWFLGKSEGKIDTSNNLDDLKHILSLDTDWMIYKPFLLNLAKYKLKDLEEIAEKEGIGLVNTSTGKKKLKKDIYNEINLKHFTQDI